MTQKERGEPFHFERGKPACLLIHGFSNTALEMREMGEFLAERDITVRGVLLPGHGTSPSDLNKRSWREWYDHSVVSARELKELSHMPVIAIGSSLGGALSLHLTAHREVEAVAALVTPIRLKRWQIRAVRVLSRVVPFFPKGTIPTIKDPDAQREHISYEVNALRAMIQVDRFLSHLVRDLPEIEAPLLLINSDSDPLVDPNNQQEIMAAVRSPVKRGIWVSNSLHNITVDYDKERVFDEVSAFVAAVQSAVSN